MGGHPKCSIREEDKDCTTGVADKLYPSIWLSPAYVGESASRMLRRTCELFEQTPASGLNYGQNISIFIRDGCPSKEIADSQFQRYSPTLLPEKAPMKATQSKNAVKIGEAPEKGSGPPKEMRAVSFSESYAVGESEKGEWAYVHFTGPDAYEVTAIAAVAGALTLVEEIDDLKPRAGVLTPAYAFHGSTWVDRIQERGFANTGHRRMKWTVHDGKPPESKLNTAIQKKRKDRKEYRVES